MSVRLASSGSYLLRTTIAASADPTGTAVEYAVTTAANEPAPADAAWTAGTWESYNAGTDKAICLSPRLGSLTADPAADIELTEGVFYHLWVRWSTGVENPVDLAETLDVY